MVRYWRRMAAAGTLAVMVACGGGGGAGTDYPPEVVDQFLASCTAGGTSEEVCQCALDKLEDRYSIEEFTEEADRLTEGEASAEFTQDIVNFSTECVEESA